jgi:hypothetical protein
MPILVLDGEISNLELVRGIGTQESRAGRATLDSKEMTMPALAKKVPAKTTTKKEKAKRQEKHAVSSSLARQLIRRANTVALPRAKPAHLSLVDAPEK